MNMVSALGLALASLACLSAHSAQDIVFMGDGGENIKPFFSSPMAIKAGACYRFSFAVRREADAFGRCVTSGFPGQNVDICEVPTDWKDISYTLIGPEGVKSLPVKFGIWRVAGSYRVRGDWKVEEVEPRFAECDAGVLGDGESVNGNAYTFISDWWFGKGTWSRPLENVRGIEFNSGNMVVRNGGEVRWRFGPGTRPLLDGRVLLSRGGKETVRLKVQAAADGGAWEDVRTIPLGKARTDTVEMPASMFPCKEVRVRISPEGGGASLQYVAFTGTLAGKPLYAQGATRYAAKGETVKPFAAKVNEFHLLASGSRIECGAPFVDVWRESACRKVSRIRPVPAGNARGIALRTARNEAEAAQLVLTPKEKLSGVSVSLSPDALSDGKGNAIAAEAVDILRVGYVPVAFPTTHATVPADYPDPLFVQKGGVDLAAGENQPFWVRVKPPAGTPAGRYRGSLAISGRRAGDGAEFSLKVPFAVEVFDFAMPDVMTCRTAFGCSTHFIDQYYRLQTSAQRAKAYELFMKAMADSHLSPYDPAPHVRWSVRWKGLDEAKAGDLSKLEPEFDFKAWDAAMEKAFAENHINSFRVADGLGVTGSIAGFKRGTPEHEAMFPKLISGFGRHLREKGWLDKALGYFFDEPLETADARVVQTQALIKRYAPGLATFLPTPVRGTLLGGTDIWCPVPTELHLYSADKVKAAGERFWWYICLRPRTPYVSLFIDAPGIDLRVWLWQTWAEGIEGVQIWNTTYWNSPSQYPDPKAPQNPYLDTISWNRAGSFFYGNGDGRMFYPPLAAVEPGAKDPVLEPPVVSVRTEMLREGIEDFEYFAMLRRLLKERGASLGPAERASLEKLLVVPSAVTSSLTSYSRDPAALEKHRLALARAIAYLSRLP